MRPLVKLEDGAGPVGSQAEEAEGLQEEAGAGRAVQRRRVRVGEAGHAALDEVQLLRLNMEAQAQAIHGMEQWTRVLGEELQRVKAGEAELAAELKVKDIMMQAKDDMLQAKDREISLLAQAKDREISLLRADNARLSAESAAVGASRQPAPRQLLQITLLHAPKLCSKRGSECTGSSASARRRSAGGGRRCSNTGPPTCIFRIC
jgi:hypothetical protein